LSAAVAQHVPLTNSTLKGNYRFYIDSFGITAHSTEVIVYQYLTPWLYLRASGRLHDQTAVDFFDRVAPSSLGPSTPRTADSDLAAFASHEASLALVLYRPRAPLGLRDDDSIDLGYTYYVRSNDLFVHALSLGYLRTF
jgi:hypothetical protein